MAEVLVLGKGGFGVQLAEWLQSSGLYGTPVFLDDNAEGCAGKLMDYYDPVLRGRCKYAFVGLGDNALRVQLLHKLTKAGYKTPAFIDAQAAVSPSAVLGAGTVVFPFAYVGAGVVLGDGCIINAGAVVDHNATLGQGVHAAPGAIIKAGASVEAFAKVDSGEIRRSPWEKK